MDLISHEDDLVRLSKHYGGANRFEVLRVHDGDTIIVTVPSWPRIVGEGIEIRLYGMDAPELQDGRPEIAAIAVKARDRLTALLRMIPLHLRKMRRDKFFRILADVISGGVNVSEVLVKEGLARPYLGFGPKPW